MVRIAFGRDAAYRGERSPVVPVVSPPELTGLSFLCGFVVGWLIPLGPEFFEVADEFFELVEVDRLDDIAVDCGFVSADAVLLSVGGGHDHDGDQFEFVVCFDGLDHLVPVDFGHIEIKEDDIREWAVFVDAVLLEEFECFGAIADAVEHAVSAAEFH